MTINSDGPLTVRRALALSKNMVSIRVLQVVGTQNAQKWVTRFGFEAAKHPLTLMALGAGSVKPNADGGGLQRICQWRSSGIAQTHPNHPRSAQTECFPSN